MEDLNFATRRQNHTPYSAQALRDCFREINGIINRIAENNQSILDHQESFALYKHNTSRACKIEDDFTRGMFDGRKPSVTEPRAVDGKPRTDVTWLDLIWGVPPDEFERQDDGTFRCCFRGQTVTIQESDHFKLRFSPRHPLGGSTKVHREDALAEYETLSDMLTAMRQLSECK